MQPTHYLAANAAWIAEAWPALHESRYKGTPRPWRQTDLTPTQRAELDAKHRAEKRAHGAPAGADSPAPLHLDVLDLLIAIDHTADHTARLIHATGLDKQPPTHTIGRLEYIARYADVLHDDDETTLHAEQRMRDHRAAINAQWSEVVAGQRLKAPCPWCLHNQLRFRSIGPEESPEIVVRCESGKCEPPSADCGTWHRGLPCWPFHEWEWLAKRIDHVIDKGRHHTEPVAIGYAKKKPMQDLKTQEC